jgi:deoxycytidine triphosphate deaminase
MLLRDADIVAAIKAGTIGVTNLEQDANGNIPLDSTSSVQASSLDLTVGKIFIPPASPAAATDPEPVGETGYQLMPGTTVVVESFEEITLPANIAGFGFPPSKLARNSILMTNPGHVDPGYSGTLNFTLINMGREPLSLKIREKIVTLLLIEMSQRVTKDYHDRNGAPAQRSRRNLLNRLAPDFAGFSNRMEAAALDAVTQHLSVFEDKVGKAETKFDRSKLWFTGIVTLVVGVLTLVGAYVADLLGAAKDDDLKKLESRVQIIEKGQDISALQERVKRVEESLPPTKKADDQ